jgi:hypothetical protein
MAHPSTPDRIQPLSSPAYNGASHPIRKDRPGRREHAGKDFGSLTSWRVSNVLSAAGMIAGLIGMIRNSRRESSSNSRAGAATVCRARRRRGAPQAYKM